MEHLRLEVVRPEEPEGEKKMTLMSHLLIWAVEFLHEKKREVMK